MYGTCGRIDNKADFDLTLIGPIAGPWLIAHQCPRPSPTGPCVFSLSLAYTAAVAAIKIVQFYF